MWTYHWLTWIVIFDLRACMHHFADPNKSIITFRFIISLPAFLVSTKNWAVCPASASLMPRPVTLTLDASPTCWAPTMILKGLLGICCPRFLTLTRCSPISLGVNVIPAGSTKGHWIKMKGTNPDKEQLEMQYKFKDQVCFRYMILTQLCALV